MLSLIGLTNINQKTFHHYLKCNWDALTGISVFCDCSLAVTEMSSHFIWEW